MRLRLRLPLAVGAALVLIPAAAQAADGDGASAPDGTLSIDATVPPATTAPDAGASIAEVSPADAGATGTNVDEPRRIHSRVSVNGIPVGGLTVGEARALLTAKYAKLLTVLVAERRFVMSPKQLGFSINVNSAVARALARKAAGDIVVKYVVSGQTLAKTEAYMVKVTTVESRDAGWVIRATPRFVTSIVGAELDQKALDVKLRSALAHPSERRFRALRTAVLPAVKTADVGPLITIDRGNNTMRRFVYKNKKVAFRRFGVATGQSAYPTPTGLRHVIEMWRDPWWYPPNSDWAKGLKPIPPGPGNPLGTRWMGTGDGIGMHGTPDDASIGYSASHGCIRMHVPDAEWLFDHIRIGTPVFIYD